MKTFRKLFLTNAILLAALITFGQGISPTDYNVTWVGNTFKGEPGFIPQDTEDIFVTPDGTVFTNTTWEESRNNVVELKDGEYINGICPFAGEGGGTVPRYTGEAVTANSTHVFYGSSVTTEPLPFEQRGTRITRRPRGLNHVGQITVNATAKVKGLAATDTHVYAACADNTIRKFTTDLILVDSWTVPSPGKMTLDHEGNLWIVSGSSSILRYDTEGNQLPQFIALPPHVIPLDVALMRIDGRLLIADGSINEQILIYKDITTTPVFDTTFGVQGGVLAGPVPGLLGEMRFLRPIGVGSDDEGNIYVANGSPRSGGGHKSWGSTLIQSYTLDGQLNWRVMAQEWTDCGDMDPYTTIDLYSKNTRYKMNFSESDGKEAELHALTFDRHSYPDDARHHELAGGVTLRYLDGQKFLFMNNMFGVQHIYRFDGEITVPAGRISANQIWIDLNGNGQEEPHEITSINLGESRGWWTDEEGTVWAVPVSGSNIYKFPLQGINGGVPVYTASSMVTFQNPGPITNMRRIRYYPDEDVLYLGGGTAQDPTQHWKPMGPNLVRFDNWHTNPTLTYHKVLPYQLEDFMHESYEPHGFDVAGDYVFTVFVGRVPNYNINRGTVMVTEKATGDSIGLLETPLDFGPAHLGIMDICQAIRAYKRPNGEYIVMIEEDGRHKITTFRWCPSGDCSEDYCSTQVDSVLVEPSSLTLEGYQTDSLSATVFPEDVCVDLVFWHTSDETIVSVNSNGHITGQGEGSAWIIATSAMDPAFSDSAWVTVNQVPLEGISFDTDSIFIPVTLTGSIPVTYIPENALNRQLSWESGDTGIATVDENGIITGISEGSTFIVATSLEGEFTDTCYVVVTSKPLESFEILYPKINVWVDDFTRIDVRILPEDASNNEVIWSIDNEQIATIDEHGVVTGVSPGQTFAVGTTADGGLTDTCQVYVLHDHEMGYLDVGNPCGHGSTTFTEDGKITILGNGDDIWFYADQFHYAYFRQEGDGVIVARVRSMENTDPWAKAGVMMRETIATGSKHAMMVVTPQNGTSFQRRYLTDDSSDHTTPGDGVTAPYWVKIVRQNNTFTGFKSVDGIDWTEVGSATIEMDSRYYIGLPVTAHNVSCVLNESVFDWVFVSDDIHADFPVPSKDATLADLMVDGSTLDGFDPSVVSYLVEVPEGTTEAPHVDAVKSDENAVMTIAQAPGVPGVATIEITAEDSFTKKNYEVSFTFSTFITDVDLNTVRIFPNPAGNFINVVLPQQSKETTTIRIFDLSGRLKLEINEYLAGEGNTVLVDVSMLNEGSYILEMGNKNKYRVKFIIKK